MDQLSLLDPLLIIRETGPPCLDCSDMGALPYPAECTRDDVGNFDPIDRRRNDSMGFALAEAHI